MTAAALSDAVRSRVGEVADPEFPGVSIEDLGILHDVRIDPSMTLAEIDLLPTFLGCPALELIESDVRHAALTVPGIVEASVRFLAEPQWSPARITDRGRRLLADEFTVAVRPERGVAACPVCGSEHIETRSMFGPTACRAIGYCSSCRNPVEVMRG